MTTKAKQAILIDAETGSVLFEKNADQAIAPASLAKLATLNVLFGALKSGEVSLEDEFFISEFAWRNGGAPSGGSAMFAKINDNIRVADLLRGIIVQSGNDASIAVAENMSGSEIAFATRMTTEARDVGLKNSIFANSTGLPDENNRTTVRDIALLAQHITRTYPEYYKIFSETEFTWNRIRQTNRNPLLRLSIGADGLKTGFVKESGYSLAGSAIQDGRRLITVVSGLENAKARGEEARRLLVWGFTSFVPVSLFEPDTVIAYATAFGGAQSRVPLKSNEKVVMFRERDDRGQLRGNVVYRGPIVAPKDAGEEVATLEIRSDDRVIFRTPLALAEDLPIGPLHQRAFDALREVSARLFREQVLDRLENISLGDEEEEPTS